MCSKIQAEKAKRLAPSRSGSWLGRVTVIAMGILIAGFALSSRLWADSTNHVTMTVTVKGAHAGQPLQASDFKVTDNGQLQNIDLVAGPQSQSPLHVAVVLEEGIAGSINNELSNLRQFVEHLPPGTNVMVATIDRNHSNTITPFTTDLKAAAHSIPIILNYGDETPSNAFVSLSEVIEKFDGISGRKEIVMIGPGFDFLQGAIDPLNNIDLQQAETQARHANVVVHTIWVPSAARASNFFNLMGSSNMLDLARTTGGQSVWNVDRFVVQDLTPRLHQIAETFDQQYIIRFSPDIPSSRAHRIKVSVENVPNAKSLKVDYPKE